MVTITAHYTGELHTEATHGPSGAVLATDAPVDNQGKGEAFSPTDLVATALLTCILTTMGIQARTLGVSIDGARGEVTKEMQTERPRRIRRLAVTIHMPPGLDEKARTVLERAAHTCPVHTTLGENVEMPVTLHWS